MYTKACASAGDLEAAVRGAGGGREGLLGIMLYAVLCGSLPFNIKKSPTYTLIVLEAQILTGRCMRR